MKKIFCIASSVFLLLMSCVLPCYAAVSTPVEQINFADSFNLTSVVVEDLTHNTTGSVSTMDLSPSLGSMSSDVSFQTVLSPATDYRFVLTFDAKSIIDLSSYSKLLYESNLYIYETWFETTFEAPDHLQSMLIYKSGNVRSIGSDYLTLKNSSYIASFETTLSNPVVLPRVMVYLYLTTQDWSHGGNVGAIIDFTLSDLKISDPVDDALNSLESAIIGDPNAPEPPSVGDLEDEIDREQEYIQDIFDVLQAPNFNLGLVDSIFEELVAGFVIVRAIWEVLLSIRFILILISVMLFIGLAVFILRMRR